VSGKVSRAAVMAAAVTGGVVGLALTWFSTSDWMFGLFLGIPGLWPGPLPLPTAAYYAALFIVIVLIHSGARRRWVIISIVILCHVVASVLATRHIVAGAAAGVERLRIR